MSAQRTTLVTGSASGIGAASAALLRARGERVIGLDLHDADVVADLSTPDGRQAAIDGVHTAIGDGALDAVIACAGTFHPDGNTVRVNYFGLTITLDGVRPLLARSSSPRAVVLSSVGILFGTIPEEVEACLAGDEEAAFEAASIAPVLAYGSSKMALARWVRRMAPTAEWAGSGIALNAVGPGTVETPMIQHMLDDPQILEMLDVGVPMPLSGHAQPEHIAPVLAFLASAENTHMTGQVIFVDGGADAIRRGDAIF